MNIKTISMLVAIPIAAVIGYGLGAHQKTNRINIGLQATQAELAFNHLRRYEELSACLEKGKEKAAALKLQNSIINEKSLVSEFLKKYDVPETIKYIDIRYPGGAESLKKFVNKRGDSYGEPSCE